MGFMIYDNREVTYDIRCTNLQDMIDRADEIIKYAINEHITKPNIKICVTVDQPELNPPSMFTDECIAPNRNTWYKVRFNTFAQAYGSAEMIQNYNSYWDNYADEAKIQVNIEHEIEHHLNYKTYQDVIDDADNITKQVVTKYPKIDNIILVITLEEPYYQPRPVYYKIINWINVPITIYRIHFINFTYMYSNLL